MFPLCLAGMITLQDQANNLVKLIFFGIVIKKPRSGVVHELMIKSRARFKYLKNQVLRNEKPLHAAIICLLGVVSNASGKKVKKYNSGNVANSNRIENETGSRNFTNMWHGNHKQLFDSLNVTDDQPYAWSYIRNNLDSTDAVVTVDDIICAIKELPNNKSPGYDGFMSYHFKYAPIVCISWWQLS